jgi:surfeit locus 1 family protein
MMKTNHNSAPSGGEPKSNAVSAANPAANTTTNTTTNTTIRRLFWSTLLLAFGLAIFLSAGFWQLNRAQEKRDFITSFNDASQTPVLTAPVDLTEAENMLYRRFALSGNFEPEKQVLLDNMVSEGEVGYQVLTPFRLAADSSNPNAGKLIVVNRGWAKGSADRLQLPNTSVPANTREVRGRLAFLPSPGIRLEAPLPDPASVQWPLVMTWPTTAEISALLGEPVLEWQLLLDADATDGYRRAWEPEIMSPETHLGYALQWFSFAALALIIYTFLNFRAARKQRLATAENTTSDTSSTL